MTTTNAPTRRPRRPSGNAQDRRSDAAARLRNIADKIDRPTAATPTHADACYLRAVADYLRHNQSYLLPD